MWNPPAAEGAIHPETLRQKDRSCSELWRAAHPIERSAHRWGNVADQSTTIRHGNLSGTKDRGVNSMIRFEFALFLFLEKA
jgi:hypothetical protein